MEEVSGVSKFTNLVQSVDDTDLVRFINEVKIHNGSEDLSLIRKSYEFSKKKHEGQMRLSGDPYFSHCRETARILVSWQMDVNTISAGLLHDVLEDTPTTSEELSEDS